MENREEEFRKLNVKTVAREAPKRSMSLGEHSIVFQWSNPEKRADGIEPTSLVWKTKVLPLNYARRVQNPALTRLTRMGAA